MAIRTAKYKLKKDVAKEKGKFNKGGPNTGELRECIAAKVKAGTRFRAAQTQCALEKKKLPSKK